MTVRFYQLPYNGGGLNQTLGSKMANNPLEPRYLTINILVSGDGITQIMASMQEEGCVRVYTMPVLGWQLTNMPIVPG